MKKDRMQRSTIKVKQAKIIIQWFILTTMIFLIISVTINTVNNLTNISPNVTTAELKLLEKIWFQVLFTWYFAIFLVAILLLWGVRNIK